MKKKKNFKHSTEVDQQQWCWVTSKSWHDLGQNTSCVSQTLEKRTTDTYGHTPTCHSCTTEQPRVTLTAIFQGRTHFLLARIMSLRHLLQVVSHAARKSTSFSWLNTGALHEGTLSQGGSNNVGGICIVYTSPSACRGDLNTFNKFVVGHERILRLCNCIRCGHISQNAPQRQSPVMRSLQYHILRWAWRYLQPVQRRKLIIKKVLQALRWERKKKWNPSKWSCPVGVLWADNVWCKCCFPTSCSCKRSNARIADHLVNILSSEESHSSAGDSPARLLNANKDEILVHNVQF